MTAGKRPRPAWPRQSDSVEEARRRGLRLLTIRARGRVELVRCLEEKGFSAHAAREAVSRLEREGWLDDLAAAQAAVRSLSARYGRARVERELSARGFSGETREAALAGFGGEEEEKALSRLFARVQRATAGLDREKRRRRIWSALTRRGFAAASISAKMKGPPGGNDDREDIG